VRQEEAAQLAAMQREMMRRKEDEQKERERERESRERELNWREEAEKQQRAIAKRESFESGISENKNRERALRERLAQEGAARTEHERRERAEREFSERKAAAWDDAKTRKHAPEEDLVSARARVVEFKEAFALLDDGKCGFVTFTALAAFLELPNEEVAQALQALLPDRYVVANAPARLSFREFLEVMQSLEPTAAAADYELDLMFARLTNEPSLTSLARASHVQRLLKHCGETLSAEEAEEVALLWGGPDGVSRWAFK
jgi:hypothetical protein